MATQDTSNNQDFFSDLQRHSALQDARISNLETKFEMFMQSMKETTDNLKSEMQDFKNEMRQQNEMRAAEIKETRDSIKEIYQATDAKVSKIESKIDSMGNHIRNLAIAAMVGIIAAGAGIAAMVISALTKS